MFEKRGILIWDIETDSLSIESAKVKWFGAYSYHYNEYYLLEAKKNVKEIHQLLKEHPIHITFNGKEFDIPIFKNNIGDEQKISEIFDYKTNVDLLEISAPKSSKSYGQYRKNRLAQMGIKLKNHTLKNICEALKLDDDGTKGDIDYHIFQKNEWTKEEQIEIKKYLKQDIILTKKLFEWYEKEYAPLKQFLPKKDQDNFLYLRSTLAVLAYNIICNKAGLKPDFGEKDDADYDSFAGGHHIEARWDLVKGNIIEIDFASAYPHAVIQGNLCSPVKDEETEFWNGDKYYEVKGKYNKKEQGKIESALRDILVERLKAKKEGDKTKANSYKIVVNSFYGTLGNPVFKSVYNRDSASDCTTIVRNWMRILAHRLDKSLGCKCLYGFTDSIFILLPEDIFKEDVMYEVDLFLKEAKSKLPFPMDSFNIGIEEEIKMIWFVAKNCYLFVTNKNEVKYKSTLLNTNTPKAIMKLFDEYMKPIIIEKLEIPFKEDELTVQLKAIISQDKSLATQEYKVANIDSYKVKTSLYYKIAEKYGEGRHFLIPNKKGIGVGSAPHSKRRLGLRYCTLEEFQTNNLTIDDIELDHLLSHIKAFYEKNQVQEQTHEQKQLF